MRFVASLVLIAFCLLSVGCGVRLQPPQQGEWSDFHSDKDKVSRDARTEPEKPGEK